MVAPKLPPWWQEKMVSQNVDMIELLRGTAYCSISSTSVDVSVVLKVVSVVLESKEKR